MIILMCKFVHIQVNFVQIRRICSGMTRVLRISGRIGCIFDKPGLVQSVWADMGRVNTSKVLKILHYFVRIHRWV